MAERASRTVLVSIGSSFETGESCPHCGFDSMFALLIIADLVPRFRFFCGRSNCGGASNG